MKFLFSIVPYREAPSQGGYSGFQEMGMIEGFFLGLKFLIPGFFGYENLASISLGRVI